MYRKVNELARAIDAHLKPKTTAYHEIWLDKKPVAGCVWSRLGVILKADADDDERMKTHTYLPTP